MGGVFHGRALSGRVNSGGTKAACTLINGTKCRLLLDAIEALFFFNYSFQNGMNASGQLQERTPRSQGGFKHLQRAAEHRQDCP